MPSRARAHDEHQHQGSSNNLPENTSLDQLARRSMSGILTHKAMIPT